MLKWKQHKFFPCRHKKKHEIGSRLFPSKHKRKTKRNDVDAHIKCYAFEETNLFSTVASSSNRRNIGKTNTRLNII